MTRAELVAEIKSKKSFLCVGLDTDIEKIPKHLLSEEDPIFSFNKAIIDATKDFAVAYKPNLAFYERHGEKGWASLRKTLEYIPSNIFTIADAKRGDIGNTSRYYADTFFKTYAFDSVTIAPYMGKDSVSPFLGFPGKWAILLALTSNPGAKDFQMLEKDGKPLFHDVLLRSQEWGSDEELMYVVGATRGEMISEVRALAPSHFFLVPGVGAQGGSLEEVAKFGMNKDCGLLVNSSRGIIYSSNEINFADSAAKAAQKLQGEMEVLLKSQGVL